MKHIKNKAWLIGIIISVAVCSFITYAWITDLRGLNTYVQIEKPVELAISGGHAENFEFIDLGDIKITGNTENEHYYVFSVVGKNEQFDYDLQLSHTTNIPYKYEIYKATENNSGSIIYYSSVDGREYKYLKGAKVDGAYINASTTDTDPPLANGEKKDESYPNDYANIQKHAVPLHWLEENITPTENSENAEKGYSFVDYYVLRVYWGTGAITENKETDILYIIAEKSISE